MIRESNRSYNNAANDAKLNLSTSILSLFLLPFAVFL